ncbi:sugar ABC transporter permease [Catenulispora subtropica]|uniref:Xylose transport system permease protein XylH n=1 Tax=Catenulispora subtropica TaxID=450798 RepID=A0ABP5E139_9ACTN
MGTLTTASASDDRTAAGPPASPLTSYLRDYWARVRSGEIGSLPAVAGLLALSTVFEILRPKLFLTKANIANLFTQGAGVTIIAMGLVFVLIIGEIDLSAGFTAGLCATVMTLLMTKEPGLPLPHGNSWYVGVPAALVTGMLAGALIGWIVSKVAVPSFVVTLAAYLAFQGVILMLLGEGNIVRISDPNILRLENTSLDPAVGWILYVLVVLAYAAVRILKVRRRAHSGLASEPPTLTAIRIGSLAVLLGVLVFVLNMERSLNPARSLKGVPVIVPVIGALLLLWTFVLNRTAYGRHLYAVGGNREAARRAGIDVTKVRISAFVICSLMAAVGGIILASRANSVDANTGGSDILLKSVGAAVIGGASLFGGRGRALDAVLGGAVIAVIDNGMGSLGWASGTKLVFTGIVLLLAAGVDALSRKRAAAGS